MENLSFEKKEKVKANEGERIVSAALSFNGEIFTGVSHLAATVELEKKYPDWFNSGEEALRDGFVTSTGRFVDRVEAGNIAEKAHQIDEADTRASEYLHSEDLR